MRLLAVLALGGVCGIGCDADGGVSMGTSDAPVLPDARTIPAGAVLWAPMDSITGMTTADIAGGHTIQCTDCPSPVAGRHGGALHFNASSTSQMTVAYSADLDPSAGFTVASWVRLDSYGLQGYECFVSKPVGTLASDSYSLCVADSGRSLFFTGAGDYNYGAVVRLGEWHHLAMTWDGTTKRGYVDGAEFVTFNTSIESDTNDVILAGDRNGGIYVYQPSGDLDDIVIYGRALDVAEIAMLAR